MKSNYFKELFNTVNLIVKSTWEKETGSFAGKVNLVGVIGCLIFAFALTFDSTLKIIVNTMLIVLNKSTLPGLSPVQILIVYCAIPLFVIVCVSLIPEES